MDSKKLNIAIFISSPLDVGGGFQYETKVIDILKKYEMEELQFIFFTSNKSIIKDFSKAGYELKLLQNSFISNICQFFSKKNNFLTSWNIT